MLFLSMFFYKDLAFSYVQNIKDTSSIKYTDELNRRKSYYCTMLSFIKQKTSALDEMCVKRKENFFFLRERRYSLCKKEQQFNSKHLSSQTEQY